MNKNRLRGSGILVVVLSAIVFIIYASSTYSEQEHFGLLQKKYEDDIMSFYEKNVDNIDEIYYNLTESTNVDIYGSNNLNNY